MAIPLLEVRNLSVNFNLKRGTLPAVQDLSFSIGERETLGIVGETGCGKTVTSLSILRLIPSPPGEIIGGEIFFEGEDLLRKTDREMEKIRGREISMIFQEPMTSLNPSLSVGEQIGECYRVHMGHSKKVAREHTEHVLNLVRLPSPKTLADRYPHELSGGMRQRVMIAMALACQPKLLIADEPTTALDVTIQAQILDLLRALVAEENAALILITHDLGVVAGMCERVNVMYAGMFMETGSAEQLFGSPRHPYTLGLLQSVPRLDAGRRLRLHPIEGSPPNMLRAPTACPFQPRCTYEVDLSQREVPQLVEIEPGHKVACFNPVPVDEWGRSREAATG